MGIALMDDGRGLDPLALRKAALAEGLISSEQSLDDQSLFELILNRGFQRLKPLPKYQVAAWDLTLLITISSRWVAALRFSHSKVRVRLICV